MRWLIQQAERSQDAEMLNESLSEESRGNCQAALNYKRENACLRELVKILKLLATHCDADGRTIQPYEIIDVINEFMADEISGQR